MKNYFVLASLALMLFSCKGNLEKGTVVNKEEFSKLNQVEANDDKRFAIVGYPFIDGDITVRGVTSSDSQLPQIAFYDQPMGQGKMIGAFPIANGKGKNEFDAPETFTMEDVKFYDNEGNVMSANDKMQVSFSIDLQTNRERMKSSDGAMGYYYTIKDTRLDKAN